MSFFSPSCALLCACDLDPTLHCLQDDRVGVSIRGRRSQSSAAPERRGGSAQRFCDVEMATCSISLCGTLCYVCVVRAIRAFWKIVASISAIAKRDIGEHFCRVTAPQWPERNTPGVRLKDQGNPATRTVPQWGVGTSAMSWLMWTCGAGTSRRRYENVRRAHRLASTL